MSVDPGPFMTEPSPSPAPAPAPAVAARETPGFSTAEIDRSCRVPVLVLLGSAVFWLAVAAVLGLVAAIKAHAPGFLAGAAWLTFGRVFPVANHALVYGFAMQAGLGLGLWITCRLGRCLLEGVQMITGAAVFWNVGLLIGLGWILGDGGTGYPWLEMPRAASPILFCSFVLMAAWGLITLTARQQQNLYVSQWLVLAALLWFPWVYSSAQLLLVYFPGRGVMQAIVQGWYTHNFFELCLAPLSLALIFYFLPKLSGRPLHSQGLARFGFWLLVLFGGWGGLTDSDPVPNWLSSVSCVARVFLLVPLVAFALSWSRTLAGGKAWRADPLAPFFLVAAGSYVLAIVLAALGTLPQINRVVGFTLYSQAISQLRIHGFLNMALAGAAYYALPRVAATPWPAPSWIRIHFWSVLVGMALSVIALLVGGIVQGLGINRPDTDFLNVVRTTVPFLGTNTLGMLLLLVGYGTFALNVGRLLTAFCPCAALTAGFRAASGAPVNTRRKPA